MPAADDAKADRTLSPYFFVHSDDPQVDKLPLKDTQVEIAVAGVIDPRACESAAP